MEAEFDQIAEYAQIIQNSAHFRKIEIPADVSSMMARYIVSNNGNRDSKHQTKLSIAKLNSGKKVIFDDLVLICKFMLDDMIDANESAENIDKVINFVNANSKRPYRSRCPNCGSIFKPRSKIQEYCSRACRDVHYQKKKSTGYIRKRKAEPMKNDPRYRTYLNIIQRWRYYYVRKVISADQYFPQCDIIRQKRDDMLEGKITEEEFIQQTSYHIIHNKGGG